MVPHQNDCQRNALPLAMLQSLLSHGPCLPRPHRLRDRPATRVVCRYAGTALKAKWPQIALRPTDKNTPAVLKLSPSVLRDRTADLFQFRFIAPRKTTEGK